MRLEPGLAAILKIMNSLILRLISKKTRQIRFGATDPVRRGWTGSCRTVSYKRSSNSLNFGIKSTNLRKKDTPSNILGITSMGLISTQVLYNHVSIFFPFRLVFCEEARRSQQQRFMVNRTVLRSSRKCPPTSVKEFPSFLSQRRQKKIDEREKG